MFLDKPSSKDGSPASEIHIHEIIGLINAAASEIHKIKAETSTEITKGKKKIAKLIASIINVRVFPYWILDSLG